MSELIQLNTHDFKRMFFLAANNILSDELFLSGYEFVVLLGYFFLRQARLILDVAHL